MLVSKLSDQELSLRVGGIWTIAIALAHLAFWDQRVMYVLNKTREEAKLVNSNIDVRVYDIPLPLWTAIPTLDASRLVIETAQALDK